MTTTPRTMLSIRPILRQPRCLSYQDRTFSSTSRWRDSRMPRLDVSKMAPVQRSMQSRMKELKKGQIPEDFGILPATFIFPQWAEQRAMGWKAGQVLRMGWLYVKQTVRDTIGMIYQCKFVYKDEFGKRKRFILHKHERIEVARQLHQTLYAAIASGDKQTLNKVAVKGLAQQQIARIDNRVIAELPQEHWAVRYQGLTPPRILPWIFQSLWPSKSISIVADRQVNVPIGNGVTVRQYIARVHSTQTRDKRDGSRPVTKKMTEYIVIQRLIINQEYQEWKVWGTTKPSTFEEAKEIQDMNSKSDGGTVMDRVKDRLTSLPGVGQ